MQDSHVKGRGEVVPPEPPESSLPPGSSSTKVLDGDAAGVLIAHLFAEGDHNIPGISYAVAYRLAELNSGGDIVDVYQIRFASVFIARPDA